MIEAREYVAYAQRLQAIGASDAERAHAGRELEFARVYADHDALLAERGALDFGDLAPHAFRLLHEKPHVRERLAGRYRQVLVDELQEMKFSEGLVLRMLAQDHRKIWAPPTTTVRSTACAARGGRTSATSAPSTRTRGWCAWSARTATAAHHARRPGGAGGERRRARAQGGPRPRHGHVSFWRAL